MNSKRRPNRWSHSTLPTIASGVCRSASDHVGEHDRRPEREPPSVEARHHPATRTTRKRLDVERRALHELAVCRRAGCARPSGSTPSATPARGDQFTRSTIASRSIRMPSSSVRREPMRQRSWAKTANSVPSTTSVVGVAEHRPLGQRAVEPADLHRPAQRSSRRTEPCRSVPILNTCSPRQSRVRLSASTHCRLRTSRSWSLKKLPLCVCGRVHHRSRCRRC